MAMVLLKPCLSNHLQTGYMTIAISNPKNNGINSIFPKYRMTAVKKITCKYFKAGVIGLVVGCISINCVN